MIKLVVLHKDFDNELTINLDAIDSIRRGAIPDRNSVTYILARGIEYRIYMPYDMVMKRVTEANT